MCGYWSPAKRKSYTASEPYAEDVENATKGILQFLTQRGIGSVDALRRRTDLGVAAVRELKDTKLRTRLEQGIDALSEDESVSLPDDAHRTADERTLERLKRQSGQLTPVVHRIRCAAVDFGCY